MEKPRKTISYDYGNLIFYKNIVHIDFLEDSKVSYEDFKSMNMDVGHYFGKRKYVVIADRKKNVFIDLKGYEDINAKQVVATAIVTQNDEIYKALRAEQELYDGSFACFDNTNDAKSWAQSFFD